MRRLALIPFAVGLLSFCSLTANAEPAPSFEGTGKIKPKECLGLRTGIEFYRSSTWKWQDLSGESRTETDYAENWSNSCTYLRWVVGRWISRNSSSKSRYKHGLLLRSDPRAAIRYVFGDYAGAALEVSYCETGGTYSIYASNGQYQGLFQMGSSEREKYGNGADALAQSRAAYAYFVDSGRDWSPWECKPSSM